MRNPTETIKPKEIIEIVLRRRWYIIIPFCLLMIAGICAVFVLPKIYTSSTLILIQSQKVPEEFVRSLVSADLDSRINTISQQIKSRTNLEKIIKEFNLFPKPEHDQIFIEDKVEAIRDRISIDLIRERRRTSADAFSISFKGRDPEAVKNVTNALANYFIQENLKFRQDRVMGTNVFLQNQLSTMRNRLEELEKTIKNYRERNMGSLPEQLETNLRILDRLQAQLGEKQESLRDAKNRLAMLENQIPSITETQTSEHTVQPGIGDSSDPEQIKEQLTSLKLRYTDKHPDVIRLTKTLADLEAAGKNGAESPTGLSRLSASDRRQYEEIKREIKTLEEDILETTNQIQAIEKRVENTPKMEQELLSLKRDYDNINETYNSLLARKLEAEMSVNMESKQKGEQFRIIDPARKAERPSEPDLKKLFILFIAAGLGIGGGLVFLLEYLDSSFKTPDDIESHLDLPVLATVPAILHPRDVRMKRLNQVLSIFFIIVTIALLAGFTFVSLSGFDLESLKNIT
ncbi:MAG: XrtA system polysaccharide chain length determinant [Thermodesulfobacteriota bacterium]|nr:XrtA system polysaccharide chain length determinant [Thermodesulfobacteriota bacterium]